MLLVGLLRTINRGLALVCGLALLAAAAFVLVEITVRGFSLGSLGGAEEVTGYVMAGVIAWGLPFALTERAHIRIDMGVRKLPSFVRDLVDVLALGTVAAVALAVAAYGWRVFEKSWTSGSLANTPLETPLWIPQAVWWTGWVWFAICAVLLTAVAGALALARRSEEVRRIANMDEEFAATKDEGTRR